MSQKEDIADVVYLLLHSIAIVYPGQGDKDGVTVGCSVSLTSSTKQSASEIVLLYQIFLASDHDWRSDKMIPYVTLHMNISESAG